MWSGRISSARRPFVVERAKHATAHRLGIKSKATVLFRHLETPADRVEHLIRLHERLLAPNRDFFAGRYGLGHPLLFP
jgi:hypothetical protein